MIFHDSFSYSHPPLTPSTSSLQFHQILQFRRLCLNVRLTPTPVPLTLLMLKARHLLRVYMSLLQLDRLPRNDMRLPRQGPDEFRSQRVRKHVLDLFQRLARRLREGEEDVDSHGEAEDAEDEVRLPLDVFKGGRDEVAQSEIKGPVGRGGERDGLAAHAERVEFGRVDPGDGAPGGGVGGDEEVGAGDDGFGRGAADGPGGFGGVVHTVGAGVVAVGFQEPTVGEHPGHHGQGADYEGGTTGPAVDEEEGGDGEDDVDDVLDARGDEEVVPFEAGHGEDVGDIVHHDVHSCQVSVGIISHPFNRCLYLSIETKSA